MQFSFVDLLFHLWFVTILLCCFERCCQHLNFFTGIIATGARDGNIIIWDKRCKPDHFADRVAPAHHMGKLTRQLNNVTS